MAVSARWPPWSLVLTGRFRRLLWINSQQYKRSVWGESLPIYRWLYWEAFDPMHFLCNNQGRRFTIKWGTSLTGPWCAPFFRSMIYPLTAFIKSSSSITANKPDSITEANYSSLITNIVESNSTVHEGSTIVHTFGISCSIYQIQGTFCTSARLLKAWSFFFASASRIFCCILDD